MLQPSVIYKFFTQDLKSCQECTRTKKLEILELENHFVNMSQEKVKDFCKWKPQCGWDLNSSISIDFIFIKNLSSTT